VIFVPAFLNRHSSPDEAKPEQAIDVSLHDARL
jgi:hypothetical protein